MKRKNIGTIALVALFVGLVVICATSNSTLQVANVYFNSKTKKLPIYSVQTTEKKVAISFDAAWGADKTAEIMTLCEEYGVNATFFLVGFWVEDYPDVARSIAERGFEIGLHSSTHPDMCNLSASQMSLELTKNQDIIQTVCGVEANLFRPPYGSYNNTLIDVCKDLDIIAIQWDVDSLDWKGLSASEIAGRVCSKSKNGSIVLFHNNSYNIIAGLKLVLEYYKNNGFEVVPVGELIYHDHYTINQQGQQIPKN
ncbi:MAG: polysaccharide deacetylase family protein [Clostridia bacterium]|nr:polysaccharide deacetylase family protein [Clostridia bacterium]